MLSKIDIFVGLSLLLAGHRIRMPRGPRNNQNPWKMSQGEAVVLRLSEYWRLKGKMGEGFVQRDFKELASVFF